MMRFLLPLCVLLLTSQINVAVLAASPPDTLTLADLVGHPERWPATVTATANVRSGSGQTVQQGQRVPVVNVTEKGVFVLAPTGGQLGLFPAQCDLLEQANARWSKLTPRQRALNAATVLADSSLWPETVRLLYPMQVSLPGGGTRVLPPGHTCRFLYYHEGNIGVVPEGVSELKWFTPDSVDLVGGALERVERDQAQRPAHLVESLRGIMRGPDGKKHTSGTVDQTQFFVFFWGANWCGWCHRVSPELAAFIQQHQNRLQHVTMMMLNGDKQESEMLKYLREKELPWPAVRQNDWMRIPYLGFTHEGGYPQLLITDRYGKIIYNGFGGGPENIKSHLAAMTQLLASAPAGSAAGQPSGEPAASVAGTATAGSRPSTAPAERASSRPSVTPTAAARQVEVEPLAWTQLVRRREAWPQQATVNREIRISGGATVRAGSPITIIELKGNQVVASANRGAVTFAVEAEATDVLAVANAEWSALTSEQRDLSYAGLSRRPDLWPYQLKLAVPVELSGAPALRAGDSVLLLGYEGDQLLLRIRNANMAFNLGPENTDLLAQARAFLAAGDGAPGRLLEELAGKLVDPMTGRPTQLDATSRPKHVVLYMGAGWCAPCKVFAPKLVQVLKAKANAGELALIYLSGDKTAAEAKRYVTGLGISWPMLSFTQRDQIPAFQSLFGNTIPQLVVTDRHGTVVIDSAKVGPERALAQLRDL
jgi:thiol-disulfide isomerase/thioredoxin